jgi:hypothetical protein
MVLLLRKGFVVIFFAWAEATPPRYNGAAVLQLR